MSNTRFWNLLSKKLSGEALPSELEELEQLISEYPELAYSARQLENLWKQGSQESANLDAETAFELHLEKLKKSKSGFTGLEIAADIYKPFDSVNPTLKRKRVLLFSLSIVCVLIFSAILWRYSGSNSEEPPVPDKSFTGEVSTTMGNRTRLLLPDSSEVWLNANSKLTYDKQFGIKNRNTTLTGEAFFEVRKGSLPFQIKARGVQVKVMGTAFNIKSYPDEKTTVTSLIRGKVEITIDKRPGETFVLNPDEKLIVADEQQEVSKKGLKKGDLVVLSQLTHNNDDIIIETSWVDNKLVFENESFAELAEKMERWYAVSIEFRDDEIANQRLSGTFTNESIQEALEELQMTTRFHYTIKSNSIIIMK